MKRTSTPSSTSRYIPLDVSVSIDDEGNGDPNEFQQELLGTDAKIYGYKRNGVRVGLYFLANFLFLGIPYLIGRWFRECQIYFTCTKSPLRTATKILLLDDEQYFPCNIIQEYLDFTELPSPSTSGNRHESEQQANKEIAESFNEQTPLLSFIPTSSTSNSQFFRYFDFQHQKFVWDEGEGNFRLLSGLEGLSCSQLLQKYNQGLSHERRLQLRRIYGINIIDVQVKSYGRLLVEEVFNPFYVFQIFSTILWCFDNYYYYAGCVVVISIGSILVTLYETKKQLVMLREMAHGNTDNFLVIVQRSNGREEEISCKDLVPGDVVLIPSTGYENPMPCDLVLTHGTALINESVLTGESIPVRKSELESNLEFYDPEIHKRHTIFAGTQVIQTRYYAGNKVSGVVVRIGFNTLKGQLIRSIMFPKEQAGFDFYKDAMKFVLILFGVACFGMAYCIWLYMSQHAPWDLLIIRVLDIVTIIVPPALPAALNIGITYAQARLKAKKIYCIQPKRINFCGKVKFMCFDKTGTLTEELLELWSVVPCYENSENSEGPGILGENIRNPEELPSSSVLVRGMASCHSLTYIRGVLQGDPLDIKMFGATGWELEEPLNNQDLDGDARRFDLLTPSIVKKGDTELGIIREFEFIPQLQRMSVIVKPLDSRNMILYCKGSPERIRPFCSNIPANYDKVLDSFTIQGFRVLGMAYREIRGLHWHQVQRASREDLEKDLKFAGFIVMQNMLKGSTVPVIQELLHAEIRMAMVTGDNLLTAISVARESGMIPSCDYPIIVNASADGELKFTLAAHHYEPEERHGSTSSSTINSDSNDLELSTRSRGSTGSEYPTLLQSPNSDDYRNENYEEYGNQDYRRNSRDLEEEEQLLVPITSEANNILRLDSDYHFVLTGTVWNILYTQVPRSILEKVVAKGTVYARMSPESKRQLVEVLQSIGYITGFTGDGANDCAALKMAHVGVSLSEAEASVAAPFTSKIPDISCVPHLIREGRCALVTSFSLFKYMALYSMVQFTTVLLLYSNHTNLSDTQFLYIDLGITTFLAIFMGRTEPHNKISSKQPMGTLASVRNIISILAQIIIAATIQGTALVYLQYFQPWYIPLQPDTPHKKLSWETTTLFSVSAFQYLILALVFSPGYPFRKPFYTNKLFLIAHLLLTAFTIWITVQPVQWIASMLVLKEATVETNAFRLELLILVLVNFVVSFLIESFLSKSGGLRKAVRSLRKGKTSKYKYVSVLENLKNDPSWPPVRDS